VVVHLTPAGRARFMAVQEGLLEQVKLIFSLLPAPERQKLLDDLERYVGMVQIVLDGANERMKGG
jgi:DNA-binding MarR family transcriptional regulator